MGDFMTVLAGALETESTSAGRWRTGKKEASTIPTLWEPPKEQTQHEFDVATTRITDIMPHVAVFNVSQYTTTPYRAT